MPVTIDWDNEEKTVVRMGLDGNWTWDEVYPASQEGYAMLESVDYVVDVIMDMRQSRGIPNSSIFHARNTMGKRHPRTGLTVFVGANTLFFSIWRVFNKVYSSLGGPGRPVPMTRPSMGETDSSSRLPPPDQRPVPAPS